MRRNIEDIAARSGLESRVEFILGNRNTSGNLSPVDFSEELGNLTKVFAPKTNDDKAARSFRTMYGQFAAILKPGEWCWTPKFDVKNPDHCRRAELLEVVTGVGHRDVSDRTIESAVMTGRSTDLNSFTTYEDLATKGKSAFLWYLPLEKALLDSKVQWAQKGRFEGAFAYS